MNGQLEQAREMTIAVDLKHRYGQFQLDARFNAPASGVTAIFGPSGAGKTRLLRSLAGLDRCDIGKIRYGDVHWQSENLFVACHQRGIGYVFQDSGLLEHLTVSQNFEYGEKRHKFKRGEVDRSILTILEIQHLLNRYPAELSGGEKQRVAIARALMLKPKMLILDEPLASLDVKRKLQILYFLEKLKQQQSIPIFYVSHSVQEISRLADYIVMLDSGKVTEQGPIQQLLSSAKFNHAMADEPFALLFASGLTLNSEFGLAELQVGNECFKVSHPLVEGAKNLRLQVNARDVSLALSKAHDSSILNCFHCQIKSIETDPEQGQSLVHLRADGFNLVSIISCFSHKKLGLKPEQWVFAQVKAVSVY